METALEVHKVLNDNLKVVDDVEGTGNEGVEAHGSVEDLVKINQASTVRDTLPPNFPDFKFNKKFVSMLDQVLAVSSVHRSISSFLQ